MTRFQVAILTFVVAIFTTASASAEDIERHFQESFDVEKGDRLRLDHGDGDVEISVWEKDIVDVEIEYRARVNKTAVGGGAPDFTADFDRKGDTIFVRGREKGTGTTVGYLSITLHEYRYTIRGPSYVELELYGEDGSVEVRDWRADISCEVEDGDVLLTGCDVGSGKIETEDGDLDLKDCRGNFEIRNQDGDVTLRGHGSGPLRVETEDGDVELSIVKAGEIDLEVRTQDGSVRIELAPGIAATFEIDTDDGWVDVDLPDARTQKRRHGSVLGTTGPDDTEGRIRVRTQDGNVELMET